MTNLERIKEIEDNGSYRHCAETFEEKEFLLKAFYGMRNIAVAGWSKGSSNEEIYKAGEKVLKVFEELMSKK